MESNDSSDGTPAPGPSRPGPVLATMALSVGPVPQIRLLDGDPTEPDRDGTGESDPAVRLDPSEIPAIAGDVSHLELLGEIARGGMGAVLKGRDPDLGRDLAIKVLLESHKNRPDLARRFIEEAQIAGQLQHPGIVPVYELGAFADRRPYFAMKLVKGRTLAALLEGRSDPTDDLPRFIAIFEQVCRTMAYAHARGVIHRDLKPSNIMVGGFGEVQVMDWGLAKVLASGGVADESRAVQRHDRASFIRTLRTGSDADASQAGSVMGTPAYMPPEQAGGDVDALDERADVFGLGAILCEILTNTRPYVGRDGNEVFRKAIRGDLADAMARLDSCGADEELIALARACLSPELLDRPRDARVVSERLTDHLAGVQERLRAAELARAAESARALEAVRKARAERRARLLAAGLAAAAFVAIAIGGGATAWFVSARNARRAAEAREIDERLGRVVMLRARARAAPPGEVLPWKEAIAEASRAAERVRELADPERADRIARDIAELDRGRRDAEIQAEQFEIDRTLLADLESARGARAEHGDPKRTDAEYAAAFRKAGLDLDRAEPDRAGAWVAARGAPLEMALFLDDWATVRRAAGAGEGAWRRLVAAARAADPHPWRDALRAGIGLEGPKALAALLALAADEPALASQPAEGLRLLALRLKAAGDSDAAARVLRRAWRMRPDDFWIHFDLAESQGAEGETVEVLYPRPEEAVRHLTAALAVRPRSPMAHTNLGGALQAQGKAAEAVAELREAIRLKPDFVAAHNNLGNALLEQGLVTDAVAAYRETIRLKPDDPEVHYNLGIALNARGQAAEAVAAYREAIRLKPDYAYAHSNLGGVLYARGQAAESAAEFREAIRLRPDDAIAHYNLGNALRDQGRGAEAVAAYREAIRLKPDYAYAHCNLGLVLKGQWRFREALIELRRGHELGSKRPDWSHPSTEWVRQAERLAALEPRLPALLRGEEPPRDGADGVVLADMAYRAGRLGASARLYAGALRADPRLADDRAAQHAYNAACAAALVGCGRGKDDPPLDDAARAGLRRQALGWLKAELAAWGRTLDAGDPKVRPGVARALRHWKVDADLAGVRDADTLAKLAGLERDAWQALWADVDRLLRRAEGGRP